MRLIVDGLDKRLVIADELPKALMPQKFELTAGQERATDFPHFEGYDWMLLDSKGE